MKPYHNKGFGTAFFYVFLILIPLPIFALWIVDGQDWVDRFTTKYFSPWQSECWENAKHERVCKGITTVNSGGTFVMNEGHALFLLMIGGVVATLALNMVVQGFIG